MDDDTIDTSVVGLLAAGLMEDVSERFDGDAVVRTIALVVEVDVGDETVFVTACTDDRPWFQRAFLDTAVDSLSCLSVEAEDE